MARRAWLKLLLVVCLALPGTAYVVERGDARRNDLILDKRKTVQGTVIDDSTTTPAPLILPESASLECVLPPGVRAEIKGYQQVVDTIVDYVTTGDYKGHVYAQLQDLVDTFGPRMTGTGDLEAAIDWMVEKSHCENLENVHTEDVQVPYWARNSEAAWMTLPRLKQLNIMGLGSSVATPPQGITAEVLVVKSFDDLQKKGAAAAGKIVVFNPPWVDYQTTAQYRAQGASHAAQFGAAAALVKSATPFSINSPHTGQQFYSVENKIPVACITVEDAAMMERIQTKGLKIEVKLMLDVQNYPDTISRNTVAELLGTQLPNETVLVSGHLDSWDVGQGAMDDGGGMMMSWAAVVVLRRLALRPRRTVRALLWTGEEQGLYGGNEYFQQHKHDHQQFQLIMESDSGTFTPQGISFTGTPEATCMMREVLKLLQRINTTQVTNPMEGGPDIQVWEQLGVPTGGLINANARYFWFHHTHGDTLSVEDPDVLDRCLALWTSVAYVMADMETRLPHSPGVSPDEAKLWERQQHHPAKTLAPTTDQETP